MAGPTPLSVVPVLEESEAQAQLLKDARMCVDPKDGTELIGYAVLALYNDGSAITSSYRPGVEVHKIGNALFEGWLRSALEGQLANAIAIKAAHNVLSGND
jgi:hypothetical protein